MIELAKDPARALGLLTRLPVPVDGAAAEARGAAAAWAWPLAGIAAGGIGALILWGAAAVGITPGVAAALALGAQMMVTGAMHEDGLADCVDGFWGGWDRARRLEIMKDSAIGAYGVLALVLTILARWSAIVTAGPLGLLVAAILSRGAMTGLAAALPHARPDGLARSVGRPSPQAAAMAAVICLIAALPAGAPGLIALLVAVGAVSAIGAIARAKIGGQTGDVLGAGQQLAEIGVLMTLAAL